MQWHRFTTSVLALLLLSSVLIACGDSTPTPVPEATTAVPTAKSAATATTAPVPTTAPATATTAPATPTTAPATPTTASTTAPATTAAPTKAATTVAAATGPGSELVGQMIAAEDTDVRVKNVARFTELKDNSKTATPKGIFMVVVFELANLGKKPTTLNFVNLLDDKNREFTTTSDGDALGAVFSRPEFNSSLIINPGFVGIDVQVYDVPVDANGFRIEADKFLNKSNGRKPSEENFAISGGKGPDSGAGQELVGKTYLSKDKVTAKITRVERLNEVTGGSKPIKAEGTFLIVVYDIKNEGEKPASFLSFYVKDSEGRSYSSSSNFDVAIALGTKYKTDYSVNPGQSGQGFKVFEVLKEAKGFELVESF